MANERVNVTYSGRVQGVGFRATTRHLAQNHGVTGTVKNRPGGDVELVAEGTPEDLEAFLNAVRQRMGRNIADENSHRMEATGEFADFRIAR